MTKLPDFSPEVRNLNKKTMTVKIVVDKKSVSVIARRTQDYKSIPEKLRPGLIEVADYVRGTMIPYVFQKEGPGWHRLAKRTQRERAALGFGAQHPILRRTDDLYKELTDKNHPRHIEIIKVGKKARIEIGGSSVKFLENQLGKSQQRLPARPMIPGTGNVPISERDKKQMALILQKAFERAINKPT